MDRQSIINALKEKLQTSPVWQKAIVSTVGRELLFYGGEVASLVEARNNAIIDALLIDDATREQLISIARFLNVSFSFVKPGVIKVRMSEVPNLDMCPYSMEVKIGTTVFTNIDFVNSGDPEIILYQGTAKLLYKNVSSNNADLYNFNIKQKAVAQVYAEYTGTEKYSRYVKLSHNAFVPSIRVFSQKVIDTVSGQEISAFPLQEWNSINSSPDRDLYRVIPGIDESINVWYGDGVWGRTFDESVNNQIVYLEPSLTAFSDSGTIKLYIDGNEVSAKIDLLSSDQPESSVSVSRIRSDIKMQMAKNSAVVTSSQIIQYVNSYQTVLDSTVSAETPAKIKVYIKPTNPNDSSFYSIAKNLDLYGQIGVLHECVKADKVEFVVNLHSNEFVQDHIKTQAIEYISSLLSYQNIGFNTVINRSILSDKVSANTGKTMFVDFEAEEQVLETTFSIKEGSIKIYNEDSVVAWDNRGELVGELATQNRLQTLKAVGCVGDMLLYADAVFDKKGTRHKTLFSYPFGHEYGDAPVFIADGSRFIMLTKVYDGDVNYLCSFNKTSVYESQENSIVASRLHTVVPNTVYSLSQDDEDYIVHFPERLFWHKEHFSFVKANSTDGLYIQTLRNISTDPVGGAKRVTLSKGIKVVVATPAMGFTYKGMWVSGDWLVLVVGGENSSVSFICVNLETYDSFVPENVTLSPQEIENFNSAAIMSTEDMVLTIKDHSIRRIMKPVIDETESMLKFSTETMNVLEPTLNGATIFQSGSKLIVTEDAKITTYTTDWYTGSEKEVIENHEIVEVHRVGSVDYDGYIDYDQVFTKVVYAPAINTLTSKGLKFPQLKECKWIS